MKTFQRLQKPTTEQFADIIDLVRNQLETIALPENFWKATEDNKFQIGVELAQKFKEIMYQKKWLLDL